MGLKITTVDTDGTKGRALIEGEFGYDAYTAGGDEGRVYVGTDGGTDIALAKKSEVDDTNNNINSVNLLRVDKYLAAQQVANMVYTDGKLSKVQYNNATDVEYEELGYNGDGKLTTVDHYLDSTLEGTTALSYTDGKLVSAIFAEV